MSRFITSSSNGRVPDVRDSAFLLSLYLTPVSSHQWIFITDTVDAVYRPDDWHPEAMMDQLSEIVGNLPVPETRVGD